MKVIRFYDDRKVVLNNVDWESICNKDIIIEYCTFNLNEKKRYIISEDKWLVEANDWDFEDNLEYFVFLDTKWANLPELEPTTHIGESVIPTVIVEQLKEHYVKKIIVYSTIKQDMADSLICKLITLDGIKTKVEKESIEIPLYDQEKIKNNLLEKVLI